MAELRQACDRCHGMKLRCPRPAGSPACTRCARARSPCTFSPPTRPLRNGHAPAHDAADAFDWAGALMAVDAPAAFVEPSLFQSELPWTPAAANGGGGGRPAMGEAAQLAEMIVVLDRVWRAFPGDDVHHVSRSELKHYADTVGEKFELQPTLELLLQNTQQLAMLYPDVVRTATLKAVDPEADVCTVPDCMHYHRSDFARRRLPKVDYALLSLLMACHQRVLDVVELLVEHGRMCAYMTAQLPEGSDPKFDIPEIRVGSFVTSKDSAASMFVSLLFELLNLLVKKSQDLIEAVSAVSADAPRRVQALALQCEDVKERGEASVNGLMKLKEGLVKIGVMK